MAPEPDLTHLRLERPALPDRLPQFTQDLPAVTDDILAAELFSEFLCSRVRDQTIESG